MDTVGNGASHVTRAELAAHLDPMKQDIHEINNTLKVVSDFMIGELKEAEVKKNLRNSRHFWIGVAVTAISAAFAGLATTLIVILTG